MSLILDALRKSEAERRRGQSPDLFAAPVVPGPMPGRTWLRYWPLAILASLLLAALFLVRRGPSTESDSGDGGPRTSDAMASPAARAMDSPARSSEAAPLSRDSLAVRQPGLAPAPSLARDTPVRPLVATVPVAPVASIASTATTPGTHPLPAVDPAPPANASAVVPADSPDSAEQPLPPISVLGAAERAALPALKLSMHVFADEPGKRFAIIDGQRVTEGAMIGPAVVTAIRRDGVVLDVNGRRVLLPRP